MNWMEFISSIIKSVIWPVSITIIVIKLKNPVSNLIKTLAKIKYKDWEFEFMIDKELDQISVQIDEAEQIKDTSKSEGVTFNENSYETLDLKDKELIMKKSMLSLYSGVSYLYSLVSKDEKTNGIGMNDMLHYLQKQNIVSESFAEGLIKLMDLVYHFDKRTFPQEYIAEKFEYNVRKSVRKLKLIAETYKVSQLTSE
ncbi:hypothetical protein ACT17G_15140 [Bacillus velezensis]|uniref:hypothetical protein n=1 Tax=Bacillus TaxID=1386 RepID=UPI00073A8E94|nr:MULTISPECIES: hypothetical protein [Bacillus]ALV02603.1 hypothetical protein AVM03_09565 [Bacillus amyloliquefaciens]ASS63469.1 hypothetical protein CHN56_03010 [Bacillus velezensis]ATC50563.1 hypothetical protein CLI97_01254 [Bacillus velezensis]MCW5195358.1 hypothetical protein [Bacillus amyloliquefaciens]MCX2811388.1 hypothetical protein [Bacillus sp. ChL18]